ncbi:MAG: hypothetical protein C5B47_05080, partial [Verrucomicrobia bacterium]
LKWMNPDSLGNEMREFEYWSQLCLTAFFPSVIHTQPSYLIRRRTPFKRPNLLCVVGTLGSGKSVATSVLKREFGYTEINSGKVVAEILGIPSVPKTSREIFQKAAWEFIKQKDGPARLAAEIWNRVERVENGNALIDGIRQRATLTELRARAQDRRVALLYVHTPPNLAFKFYRARSGRDLSIHDFLRVNDSPVEAEVKGMIGLADAVLYNWTGEFRYRDAVRQLMQEVSGLVTR